MRGEVCVGLGSLFSLAALLLLIFGHVGQINTSALPMSISMANINTSGLQAGLEAVIRPDPVYGLYDNLNASAPLAAGLGLRQYYQFGLYSYCATTAYNGSLCVKEKIAAGFTPYTALISDMLPNHSILTTAMLTQLQPPTKFYYNADSMNQLSNVGYYMLLLGTVCAAVALFCGLCKHVLTFFLSTLFSILGAALVLIGATMWTVIIHQAADINSAIINSTQINTATPVGLVVSTGIGLYLFWAGFACLIFSAVPYTISCCTYRG